MGNVSFCMEYFIGERNAVYVSNVQQMLQDRIQGYESDILKAENAKTKLKFDQMQLIWMNSFTKQFTDSEMNKKKIEYDKYIDLLTTKISDYQDIKYKIYVIQNSSSDAERYKSLNEIMIGVNGKYKDYDTDELVASLHEAENTWIKNSKLQLNQEVYTPSNTLINSFPVVPTTSDDEVYQTIDII
jgi:hypothetical protein